MITVALCALIDSENRIYITQRRADADAGGLWEFPGGKVETGEAIEAALIRELKEELGIDVSKNCLAPVTFAIQTAEQHDSSLLLLLYIARQWSGEIQSLSAICGRWVRLQRLHDFPMPSANATMVAFLRDLLIA